MDTVDLVHAPAHYDLPIEPKDYIMENGFSWVIGNIIRYASRAGRKKYDNMDIVDSEITDLRKIQEYAEYRITQLYNSKYRDEKEANLHPY